MDENNSIRIKQNTDMLFCMKFMLALGTTTQFGVSYCVHLDGVFNFIN